MTGNHLNDISKVYLDKVAEFNTDKAASDVKRWEELGGPTPQNYRPNDDSAKIKQEGYKGTADLSKADPKAKKKVEDRIDKWAGKRVPGGKKGVKESFYDWRKDIFEAGDPGANVNPTFPGGEKQGLKGSKAGEKIKEKKVDNKVIISPKISEVVQAMGGELIEAKEVECDCDCGQDPCVKCGESHHNIQEGDVFIKPTYGSPVVKPKKKKPRDTGVKNKKQLDAIRSLQTASFKPAGEQLDELDIGGALNKASTSFNKSQNPVVKTIRSVLSPVKGNKGRGTMTKQDQQNVINKNIKEGEEVKEGLGAAVVGGALATGLAIKGIQAAKKIKDDAKKGKGIGGKLNQRNQRLQQMMNQSYEPEGEKNAEVVNERLGGKGYSRKAAGSGIYKTSGDWPDSDRGAGNKAKRRAGKKVEKKSPTYLAHVHNKESYTLTNADRVANTPAWKNRDKKGVDGKPLYKLAPHLKEEEIEVKEMAEPLSKNGKRQKPNPNQPPSSPYLPGKSPFTNNKKLALAKEDRALEIVRANIIKKHGKGAIYDPKNPPKASPQPKRKPEKDTRSAAQREVDAQYGRTPWNKKGSLGT